jgi:hypothetical protein
VRPQRRLRRADGVHQRPLPLTGPKSPQNTRRACASAAAVVMVRGHAMLPYDHPEIDAAVEQACRELELDLVHAGSVHAWLTEPESDWPTCCDRGCEPCVATLADAARRAKGILEAVRGKAVPSTER